MIIAITQHPVLVVCFLLLGTIIDRCYQNSTH